MHHRKGKKILTYFFLFLIAGSINNTVLTKIQFEKIKNIQISGLNQKQNIHLVESISELNLKNIFFLNGKEISKIIGSNSLVENYEIFKKYPYTLDIKIEKTSFLARINQAGKIFIIGANGKLSKNNFSSYELPYIFGNPKVSDFLNFKKILDTSEISYDRIKSFYFFKSNRWDLELNNNILIKLSKENVKDSLDDAIEFLNNSEFTNIKVIDARIKNQIILND